MCYIDDFSKALSKDIYQQKLLPLYPHLKKVIIQGGELTVIPQASQVIEFIHAHNDRIKFEFISNGISFDSSWRDLSLGMASKVTISLNASTEETYQKVSQTAHYNRVIQNIKELIATSKDRELKVFISFVILPQNIHELKGFIQLAEELSVDGVMVIYNPKLIPEKSHQMIREQLNLANQYVEESQTGFPVIGIKEAMLFFENNVTDLSSCRRYQSQLHIDVDGLVQTCCHHQIILGNIRKTSLGKILKSYPSRFVTMLFANNRNPFCRPDCYENLNKEELPLQQRLIINMIKAYRLAWYSPKKFGKKLKNALIK